MPSPELRTRRVSLTSAWESFVRQGRTRGVRREVAASWRRSARALSPTVTAAPVDADDVARGAWEHSLLRQAFPVVEDEMRRTAEEQDYVGALTDETGRILWTAGGRTMRSRAEQVGFVPGGHWDEQSVGTNALDLALRQAAPATVYSAEHFSPAVHGWVCYAAPVTHPVTGDVLGVLDLSTTWDRAHPLALTSVTAMARAVGAELARAMAVGTLPTGRVEEPTVGAPSGPLRVVLGGDGRAECDGTPLLLTRRQREILALLILHPQGLRLDELHAHLYGDATVSTTTLKAELSHLRRAIGGGIGSRPYRLERTADCDVVAVLRAVRDGEPAAAATAYRGSLLPWSESPTLAEWRHHVDVAVRTAVLSSRDPDAAMALAEAVPGDDVVVHHAWVLLPAGDPRRAIVAGWLSAAADG